MRLVTRLCLFVLGALLATVYGGCNRPQESVLLVTVGAARGADVSLGAPAGLRNQVAASPAPDSVAAAASVLAGARPATPSWPGEGDAARVAPAVPRLAEAMKKQGYETRAYIGEGSISTLSGLARGFDSFETPSSPTLAAIAADESGRLRPWRGGFVPASEVASAFLSYLKARPNQNPLFVWIHFGDPVGRFEPAQPKEAYDAAIKDVNEAIGLLRDALDSYGLAGRTTMIVAPLYGMGLGEQGEQRFGLTLSDPVALETVSVVGSGAKRFKFPASLSGLHDAILDLLDIDAGKAPRTGTASAVAVATLPDRLYGWPALRRAADEPASPLVSNPGEGPPAEVLARMGEAHQALAADRLPEAVAALREASRLAPRAIAPRALLVQLIPPAERGPLLDELKAIAGNSVPRRIDVARTLSGAEDPAGARAILDQLVAGPLTPGERVAVAEQLSTIGATEAAIDQVQLLIDEDKDAPELYEWQGDLFMQTQNAYRARVAYEKALESPRQRSAGLVAKLGNALVDLNEKDAALLRFAEATKLDPSYRYPYTRAAELLLAQGKEGEAATALMKSVGATGDPVQDVLNQARALERAGLLSYAATIVDQALAKDPQNLALQLGMARLLGAGGRHDDARSRLQTVLAAQPGVAQAWVELARVEADAGDERAAIAALDKAEAVAGPQITETVRTDKTLLKGGPNSALARRAQAFQGRGQAKAQPPTQRAVGGAPAGTP